MDATEFMPPPPILTVSVLERLGGEFVGQIVDTYTQSLRDTFNKPDPEDEAPKETQLVALVRHEKNSLPYRLVLNPNVLTVLLEAYGLDPGERIQTDAWLGTRISATVSYKVIKSGKNKGQRKPRRVLEILEMAPRVSKPRDLVEVLPPSDATATVQPSTPEVTLKPVKARVQSDGPTWLKDTWNRNTTYPLPKVWQLNDVRIRACQRAIKEHGLDDLKKAIQAIEKSAFCRGGGDDWWKASFGWLLQGDNVLKVLEGNYDTQPTAAEQFLARHTSKPNNLSKDGPFGDFEEFVNDETRNPLALPRKTET